MYGTMHVLVWFAKSTLGKSLCLHDRVVLHTWLRMFDKLQQSKLPDFNC